MIYAAFQLSIAQKTLKFIIFIVNQLILKQFLLGVYCKQYHFQFHYCLPKSFPITEQSYAVSSNTNKCHSLHRYMFHMTFIYLHSNLLNAMQLHLHFYQNLTYSLATLYTSCHLFHYLTMSYYEYNTLSRRQLL